MLVELRHISGERLIHRVDLEDPPQPGRWIVLRAERFGSSRAAALFKTYETLRNTAESNS